MTYTAIDCQGFAGGFTLGVAQAGFKLVAKREMKGGFGVRNCEVNRHLLGDDWTVEAVNPEAWSVPLGGADFVFGNPPCSGFSVLSTKSFRGTDSKINACMWAFAEYAARVRPAVAVFESVQLAFTQGRSLMQNLRTHVEELTNEKWELYHVLHNAYSVGGPAMRKRYFWVISRIPFGIEVPRFDRYPVLTDVIGDLEFQPEAWEARPYRDDATWYSAQFRNVFTGRVDGHISIDNPNTRRTRSLLAAVEWNPGEHAQVVTRRYFDEHGDLPPGWEHLVDKLKGQDFFQGFNTPTMWRPSEWARVITGAGMLNGVHWSQQRTFTHRETARILGFPDSWLIDPLRGAPNLFLTWGKGITVHCGRWIAKWAKRALNGEPGSYTGEVIGEREHRIDVTNAWRVNCGTVSSTTIINRKVRTMTEAAVEEAVAAPKGRPRPNDTIERDELVFNTLVEPMSRETLALKLTEAGTPMEPKLIYLSLYRLRRDGRIEGKRTDGAHKWSRVEAPAA